MNNQEKHFKIKSYSNTESQRVLEYWTPERISKAKPISPKKITKEALEKDFRNQVKSPYETESIINQDNSSSLSPFLGEPYEVDVNDFPYSAGGKFLFTQGEGEDTKHFHGTAQFIGHCQMILTAAHCVVDEDTGEEYKNFAFARAYRNVDGNEEQELFAIERIGTAEGAGKFAELDFAFCRTTESYPGQTLALKIGEPAPDGHPMHAIGYPEDFNDGNVMAAVDGTREKINDGSFVMEGNPMGPGSSGGAMMVDLNIEGRKWTNLVVGLNSRSYEDDNTVELSPIFDQHTIDLYNEVLDASGENPRRC
ncbi:trypsin-like serine peptidase [Paenibacillus rhizophilus]|uniref:Serine protease n=1 Tax=Paenibacillus rhizophilus TaxID=1850366 RepID=A0A3N9P8W2_9BACL|nr:serine protease [Paenibacillus rhizophilus]RQW11564.1 serine protease [Paenibacillus rhizophilus]